MLHTGFSLPCSIFSVTLCSGTDLRLRPYPRGLIFSTGALPILNLLPSSWRRCARSCTVQVPSEQPCLLELADFLDLLVLMLMPMLECGSKVSLMSSGLTKFSDSSVVSTNGVLRALLRLLPSHELNRFFNSFFNSGFASSSVQCATTVSTQQYRKDWTISFILTSVTL